VFTLEIVVGEGNSWARAYQDSGWFSKIYEILTGDPINTSASQVKEAFNYRIFNNILWIYRRELYLPCIPESKVLAVLREAHDDSGHWAKTGTLARLRGLCYWPNQSGDVEKYIAGCLECARHGPATRSQLLNPVRVSFPFQLLGMDFIGPLAITKAGNMYIFNVVFLIVPFI